VRRLEAATEACQNLGVFELSARGNETDWDQRARRCSFKGVFPGGICRQEVADAARQFLARWNRLCRGRRIERLRPFYPKDERGRRPIGLEWILSAAMMWACRRGTGGCLFQQVVTCGRHNYR
jgi:hypothetical protein